MTRCVRAMPVKNGWKITCDPAGPSKASTSSGGPSPSASTHSRCPRTWYGRPGAWMTSVITSFLSYSERTVVLAPTHRHRGHGRRGHRGGGQRQVEHGEAVHRLPWVVHQGQVEGPERGGADHPAGPGGGAEQPAQRGGVRAGVIAGH